MDQGLKSSAAAQVNTAQISGWRVRTADYLGLEHNVTIASRSQSFDHSGSSDWWIALEDCAASSVRYSGLIGLVGTVVFIMTVEERYAS